MRRVYRQAAFRSVRPAVLLVAAILPVLAGCGRRQDAPAPPAHAAPELAPRHFELADFLASRPTGVDSPDVPRLAAAQGLIWSPDPPAPPPPVLAAAPAGFLVAAVAPRGERVALVRDIDPDSTEVLLYDRSRGETRLLLPVDRDARFLPQHFSADGERLFLFSDEADDTLQLEVLEPDTGARQRRHRPGCEALRFDSSPDGAVYALQWSCSGKVQAALFDSATGAERGPLPLPIGTRAARVLPAGAAGGVIYEVASARAPRDLLFGDRLDSDARVRPLSFGLSPLITAEDLVDPTAVALAIAGAPPVPSELWWPRRPPAPPAALIWLENDVAPPAWFEFHPFFQFLANRGVAVLRLRLRGSQGFGRRFRHAADGRLVDAGFEDIDAARAELARRGVDPQRIALAGQGPWAGALAAAAQTARPGSFAAAADLGGDPDPLRGLDTLAALPEPPHTWWLTRLGDPASDVVRRDRARMLLPADLSGRRLFLADDPEATAGAAATLAALWEFLAPSLGTPP